jgi:hypothetical protein
LGWTDGRNVRWAGGDTTRFRALARELVGLQPDIMRRSVSLKVAKALGLAIPPSIMLRADEVIE